MRNSIAVKEPSKYKRFNSFIKKGFSLNLLKLFFLLIKHFFFFTLIPCLCMLRANIINVFK